MNENRNFWRTSLYLVVVPFVIALVVLGIGYPGVQAMASTSTAASAAGENTLWSWGSGYYLQNGNGDSVSHSLPTQVDTTGVLAGKTISVISVGVQDTCVIADGQAFCWGKNEAGELGNNSTTDSAVPVAVDTSGALAGKQVTDIAVGWFFVCAIADGQPYCWGSNNVGQLGSSIADFSSVPVPVDIGGALAGKTSTKITAGHQHACVIAANKPFCWGYGHFGADPPQQPGDGNLGTPYPVPVDINGTLAGTQITAISAGRTFTCVLASGKVYCWGENPGSFGDNTQFGSATPVAADFSDVLAGKTATALATGGGHTCVIAGGQPYCWGSNFGGALGIGNNAAVMMAPAAVVTTGALAGKTVTSITAGSLHTCVVAAGQVYCWGSSNDGQLGRGSQTASSVPVAVTTEGTLAGRTVSAVAAGDQHTMAILTPQAAARTAGGLGSIGATRITDTRTTQGGAGPLTAGTATTIKVTGQGGVPATGVAAVAVTITAVTPAGRGYLAAWAAGTQRPGTSVLNFDPGRTTASTTMVRVGTGGAISIFNGSSGPVDVLVDLTGYYLAGSPPVPGGFVGTDAARAVDTRIGVGIPGAVPGYATTSAKITGKGGIPITGVTAVAVTITAVTPAGRGYLAAWAAGAKMPGTSVLNFNPGQTVATTTIVPIGADGGISIYNGAPEPTQLIVDVIGYFAAGSPVAAGGFANGTPTRVVDSRNGLGVTGPMKGYQISTVKVTGIAGVPSVGVASVSVTVTSVNSQTGGYFAAWPSGSTVPRTSVLNFDPGRTTATTTSVPVGPDGSINIYNGSPGANQLLVDVTGYYLPS